MRASSLVKALLQIEHVVVERAWFEPSASGGQALVVAVRPTKRQSDRCPVCRRRCRIRDQGEGDRRWRSLDLGSTMVYLEGPAPRVACPVHGVLVAAVPWARHKARSTAAFEDQAAWLAALGVLLLGPHQWPLRPEAQPSQQLPEPWRAVADAEAGLIVSSPTIFRVPNQTAATACDSCRPAITPADPTA